MLDKRSARHRRAGKTRIKIALTRRLRLVVHKSNKNIYAQIFDASGANVLFQASTLSKSIKTAVSNGGNVEAAKLVGIEIAKLAVAGGINEVAFDRSGFKYHGRVAALANSAREHGLSF